MELGCREIWHRISRKVLAQFYAERPRLNHQMPLLEPTAICSTAIQFEKVDLHEPSWKTAKLTPATRSDAFCRADWRPTCYMVTSFVVPPQPFGGPGSRESLPAGDSAPRSVPGVITPFGGGIGDGPVPSGGTPGSNRGGAPCA